MSKLLGPTQGGGGGDWTLDRIAEEPTHPSPPAP